MRWRTSSAPTSCAGPASGGSRSRARPNTSPGIRTATTGAWIPTTWSAPGSPSRRRRWRAGACASCPAATSAPGCRTARPGTTKTCSPRGQEISAGIDEDDAVNMEVATGEAALFAYRLAHALAPQSQRRPAHRNRHPLHAARCAPDPGRLGQRDPGQGRGQVRLLRARADSGLRLRSCRGRVPRAHGAQSPPHRLPGHRS